MSTEDAQRVARDIGRILGKPVAAIWSTHDRWSWRVGSHEVSTSDEPNAHRLARALWMAMASDAGLLVERSDGSLWWPAP